MKNTKIISLCMVAIALLGTSCSGDRLLFNNQDIGCVIFEWAYIDYSYEDLFKDSDYVYKIELKSYKGYAEVAYGCTRWDCWSFKILETYKQEKKKTKEFYIIHSYLGYSFPVLEKGQQYYIFLRDYKGTNEYIPDTFVALTVEFYSDCLVPLSNR